MPVANSYATAEEYRNSIEMTDTGKDTDIIRDLEAVSRHIDSRMSRFFIKDTEPVTRTYVVPATSTSLWVDDIAEIESIEVDGAVIEDYELWPYNADKGPEPRPYMKIISPTGFCRGQRVKVTAKFGWPAVPAAIKSATIQLTAILRLESPRATRRIEELGSTIEASPDAQSIIRQLMDGYKRIKYL